MWSNVRLRANLLGGQYLPDWAVSFFASEFLTSFNEANEAVITLYICVCACICKYIYNVYCKYLLYIYISILQYIKVY